MSTPFETRHHDRPPAGLILQAATSFAGVYQTDVNSAALADSFYLMSAGLLPGLPPVSVFGYRTATTSVQSGARYTGTGQRFSAMANGEKRRGNVTRGGLAKAAYQWAFYSATCYVKIFWDVVTRLSSESRDMPSSVMSSEGMTWTYEPAANGMGMCLSNAISERTDWLQARASIDEIADNQAARLALTGKPNLYVVAQSLATGGDPTNPDDYTGVCYILINPALIGSEDGWTTVDALVGAWNQTDLFALDPVEPPTLSDESGPDAADRDDLSTATGVENVRWSCVAGYEPPGPPVGYDPEVSGPWAYANGFPA